MFEIATPVSHLFFNNKHAKRIIKFSDCLEVRYRTFNLKFENEKLFHVDTDITLPWSKEFKINFLKLIQNKKKLNLITFQSTRCCENEKILNKKFVLAGKKFSRKNMIDNARINTKWLRESIGNKIKIGIENNNYYPTEAYNIITEGDFLQKIVYENDLFFLLDIAHAKVTSANRKIDYNTYLNELPLDRMMQVHICKPTINHAGVSYDSHYLPDNKMFKEVENLSKNYSKLKYFTIEYYKDSERLISKLKLLRSILKK